MTYTVKKITIGVNEVEPSILLINTGNTVAEVLAPGYLGPAFNFTDVTFSNKQMAVVYTTDGGAQVYSIIVSEDGIASLEALPYNIPIPVGAVGTIPRSNGTAYVPTAATFANTYNQYDILYASSANAVTGLAKASNSVLATNLGSIPAWVALGNFEFLGGSLNGPKPFLITIGSGLSGFYNSGSDPGVVNIELADPVSIAHGGTNTTSAIGVSGTLARSDGTKYTWTTATYPATAGTSGNVMTSDGTNFVSSAPAFVPMPYNAVSASTQALAVNNAYYTTYAGLCTMTLPVTAATGTIIKVRAGPSGNTFRIAQNAGQYIYYGAQSGTSIVTITGTSGYLQSVDPNTTVDLECIIADTAWIAISNVNNLQANV